MRIRTLRQVGLSLTGVCAVDEAVRQARADPGLPNVSLLAILAGEGAPSAVPGRALGVERREERFPPEDVRSWVLRMSGMPEG